MTSEEFTQLLEKLERCGRDASPSGDVMRAHLDRVDKATRSLDSIAIRMDRQIAQARRRKRRTS